MSPAPAKKSKGMPRRDYIVDIAVLQCKKCGAYALGFIKEKNNTGGLRISGHSCDVLYTLVKRVPCSFTMAELERFCLPESYLNAGGKDHE